MTVYFMFGRCTIDFATAYALKPMVRIIRRYLPVMIGFITGEWYFAYSAHTTIIAILVMVLNKICFAAIITDLPVSISVILVMKMNVIAFIIRARDCHR